eukprot:9488338-Pyramimonas_sp.AAC.1
MRDLKQTWRKHRRGIRIDGTFLTKLRFADDVPLIGSTRADVRHTLCDLQSVASAHGLKLHAGKTKILSNVE